MTLISVQDAIRWAQMVIPNKVRMFRHVAGRRSLVYHRGLPAAIIDYDDNNPHLAMKILQKPLAGSSFAFVFHGFDSQ